MVQINVSDIETCPVSVVIPCYNCAATIRRAVDSVAGQTLLPAEVILVDDASGDATREVLSELQHAHRAGWIKVVALNENGGAARARNAGWDAASHDYIAFLDADDSWHPEKISVQYRWMERNPAAGLTGHDSTVLVEGSHGQAVPEAAPVASPERLSSGMFLLSNRFSTPTVMLKRSLMQRFDPSKRRGEDYLLWLEIILDGIEVFRFPQRLAYIHKARYGAGGLSGNLWLMQQGEIDAFQKLYQHRKIGALAYALATQFSWMKYVRRVLLSKISRAASV